MNSKAALSVHAASLKRRSPASGTIFGPAALSSAGLSAAPPAMRRAASVHKST